jgi:hypothetical protein
VGDIININAVMSLNLNLVLKCHEHQVQQNDQVSLYENYDFVYILVWLQSFNKTEIYLYPESLASTPKFSLYFLSLILLRPIYATVLQMVSYF